MRRHGDMKRSWRTPVSPSGQPSDGVGTLVYNECARESLAANTHIHTRTRTHTHTHTHTRTRAHTHTRTYTNAHAHTHTHTHTGLQSSLQKILRGAFVKLSSLRSSCKAWLFEEQL